MAETIRRRLRLPAWLLSIAAHVTLFVAGILALQPVLPSGEPENPRTVAVAIVPGDIRSAPTYFAEREPGSPPGSERRAHAFGDWREALPDVPRPAAAEAPRSASWDLPGRAAGVALPGAATPFGGKSGSGRAGLPSDFEAQLRAVREAEALARGPAESLGPVTEIAVFGSQPARGRTFLFLIDRSASMGSEGLGVLQRAERELAAAVQSLQPGNRFQVLAYNERVAYFHQPGLVAKDDESGDRVRRFLEGLGAFGGTEHGQAILAAVAQRPEVIFLLTDGGDPALTAGQIREIASLAAGKSIIHTLYFGHAPDPDRAAFLEQLAAATRGRHAFVEVRGKGP